MCVLIIPSLLLPAVLSQQVSSTDEANLSPNLNFKCVTNDLVSNAVNVSIPTSLFEGGEEVNITLILYNSSSLFPDTSSSNLTIASPIIGITINSFTQLRGNISIHFRLLNNVSHFVNLVNLVISINLFQSHEIQCVFYDSKSRYIMVWLL